MAFRPNLSGKGPAKPRTEPAEPSSGTPAAEPVASVTDGAADIAAKPAQSSPRCGEPAVASPRPEDGEEDWERLWASAPTPKPIDGEPIDGEPVDGEPVDGGLIDGEPDGGEDAAPEPADGGMAAQDDAPWASAGEPVWDEPDTERPQPAEETPAARPDVPPAGDTTGVPANPETTEDDGDWTRLLARIDDRPLDLDWDDDGATSAEAAPEAAPATDGPVVAEPDGADDTGWADGAQWADGAVGDPWNPDTGDMRDNADGPAPPIAGEAPAAGTDAWEDMFTDPETGTGAEPKSSKTRTPRWVWVLAAILAAVLAATAVIVAVSVADDRRGKAAREASCAAWNEQAARYRTLFDKAKAVGFDPGESPAVHCPTDVDGATSALKERLDALEPKVVKRTGELWEARRAEIARTLDECPDMASETRNRLRELSAQGPDGDMGWVQYDKETTTAMDAAAGEQRKAEEREARRKAAERRKAENERKEKEKEKEEARREADRAAAEAAEAGGQAQTAPDTAGTDTWTGTGTVTPQQTAPAAPTVPQPAPAPTAAPQPRPSAPVGGSASAEM